MIIKNSDGTFTIDYKGKLMEGLKEDDMLEITADIEALLWELEEGRLLKHGTSLERESR